LCGQSLNEMLNGKKWYFSIILYNLLWYFPSISLPLNMVGFGYCTAEYISFAVQTGSKN